MKYLLFVDDEPMVLRGLRRAFADFDDEWSVDFATSGAEALEKLAAGPCDVLVTDMRMPGMNGAQLLNEVVQRYPQIVRIVLSGQADRELLVQCSITAHYYLSKPCEAGLVRETVLRLARLGQGVGDSAIRNLVARLTRLPSQPTIYLKLVKALESPETDMESLGKLVEADIGLTAKVLKLANSSFFGFGGNIRTVSDALGMLGIEVLKGLVLSVHVFDFSRHSQRAGLAIDKLWNSAQATAAFAEAIAREERLPRETKEAVFTASLLHNAGLLVLAENVPEQLKTASGVARTQQQPLSAGELITYGTTHAEVAGHVLALWGLPQTIVDAVTGHLSLHDTNPAKLDARTVLHSARCLVGERMQVITGVPEAPLLLPGREERVAAWRALVADMPIN